MRLPDRVRLEGLPDHRRRLRHRAAAGTENGAEAAATDLHAGNQRPISANTTRKHQLRAGTGPLRCRAFEALSGTGINGAQLADQARRVSLQLYEEASRFARTKGIIIADTKFEFGIDQAGTLHLIDEALTPDSSRFWPADQYEEGKNPPSFDKQFVRDYLETLDWNKTAPAPNCRPTLSSAPPPKYREAYEQLTGRKLD